MAFQNRLALLINAPVFERELKKHFSKRCEYANLLKFLTDEQMNNRFNGEGKFNDLVRALYFYPQTVFKDNQFVQKSSPGHKAFVGALRNMNYDVVAAYNSVDAVLGVYATQIAESSSVDTIVLLGITVDYVNLIWHLRSKGKKVVTFSANSYDLSERVREAVDWVYHIEPDEVFLGADIEHANEKPEPAVQ